MEGGGSVHGGYSIFGTGVFRTYIFKLPHEFSYAGHKIAVNALVQVLFFVANEPGIVEGDECGWFIVSGTDEVSDM